MSFAHSFIQSGIGFTHQPTSTTADSSGTYSPLLADDLEDEEQDIVDEDEDESGQMPSGANASSSRVSIVDKVKQLIAISNEEFESEAN